MSEERFKGGFDNIAHEIGFYWETVSNLHLNPESVDSIREETNRLFEKVTHYSLSQNAEYFNNFFCMVASAASFLSSTIREREKYHDDKYITEVAAVPICEWGKKAVDGLLGIQDTYLEIRDDDIRAILI